MVRTRPTSAWSPELTRTDGFTDVELSFDTLPGYGTARLVIVAWSDAEGGAGTASVDDVRAVTVSSGAGTGLSFNEFEARVLGAPGATAVLLRSGRVVFPGVSFFRVTEAGPRGFPGARFEVAERETGFAFRVQPSPGDATLHLPVNVTRRDEQDDETGWVSSLGTGGYRSHASEIAEQGVTTLLLGRGLDLLSIGLDEPVSVRGRITGDVLGLEIDLAGLDAFDVQLTFGEERAHASRLRRLAEDEARANRPGAALAAWQELLDHVPYEASLVRLAETSRSTLIQEGLEQVEALRQEVERARFFGLVELFRDVQRRASGLASQYGESEVAQQALALSGVIDEEIAAILGEETAGDRARSAIADVLERQGAHALAAHVQSALRDAGSPGRGSDTPGEDR